MIPRPIPIKQTQINDTAVLNTCNLSRQRSDFSPGDFSVALDKRTHARTDTQVTGEGRILGFLLNCVTPSGETQPRGLGDCDPRLTGVHVRTTCHTLSQQRHDGRTGSVQGAGRQEMSPQDTQTHVCVRSVLHLAAVILICLLYFPSYST